MHAARVAVASSTPSLMHACLCVYHDGWSTALPGHGGGVPPACGSCDQCKSRGQGPSCTFMQGGGTMVPQVLFNPLLLSTLVWVFLLLAGTWPSDRTADRQRLSTQAPSH